MIRRVEVFGGLRAFDEAGAPVAEFRTRKGAMLLALLAIAAPGEARREELGAALWPEAPPSARRARLRYELSLLRRLAGAEGICATGRDSVGLSERIATDIREFQRALAGAVDAPDRAGRVEALRRAARLVQRPLLHGWSEPWALRERARIESCQRDIAQALLLDLEALGESGEALLWRHFFFTNRSAPEFMQ